MVNEPWDFFYIVTRKQSMMRNKNMAKKHKTFKTPMMEQCNADNFGKENWHNFEAMTTPKAQINNPELASKKFGCALVGLTRSLIIDYGSLHGDLCALVHRKDEKEFTFDELLKEVAHLAMDQSLVARAKMIEDGEGILADSAEWEIMISTQETSINALDQMKAA